jgi:hypothetical protein
MTHILTAIIFNFYAMAWEPFPLIEIERFDRLDHCVTRMNELNRQLIREYSAVRAICQPAQ